MTLRWRLTLFYTSLLAALLLIIGVAVVSVLRTNLIRGANQELAGIARQIDRTRNTVPLTPFNPFSLNSGSLSFLSSIYPGYYLQFDRSTLGGFSEFRRRSPETVSATLYRGFERSGNMISGATPARDALFALSEDQLSTLQRAEGAQVFGTTTLTRDTQRVTVRFVAKLVSWPLSDLSVDTAPNSAVGILYVAKDFGGIDNTISQLRLTMLVVSLLVLALAGVGAYLIAGSALRPLTQVRDAAESISEKTLGRRVPEPRTGDEVQALAATLNSMLDRLENSFEAQRRFTSDASHELRTPVTAIGGHAGYLLRRTNPNPQQAESLTIIKSEADRLSNLIASLLELARSDSGVTQLRRQAMLSRLFLEDLAREVKPLAQAQNATVRAGGEDVQFGGDPDKLRQVLLNLISNALKAGAHEVTLQSAREGGEVVLRVRDDGPGIPAEHLGKLFERFYRVEESRSRDVGGSGLGLAIAKSIVDAHGGRISVESEVGRGTTVSVRLPIGHLQPEDAELEEVA